MVDVAHLRLEVGQKQLNLTFGYHHEPHDARARNLLRKYRLRGLEVRDAGNASELFSDAAPPGDHGSSKAESETGSRARTARRFPEPRRPPDGGCWSRSPSSPARAYATKWESNARTVRPVVCVASAGYRRRTLRRANAASVNVLAAKLRPAPGSGIAVTRA